ncbi:hypothetical protein LSH36_309g01036 [Paralvinella palmiformis]|uniref:Cytochrome c1, heme protein, mitochondrial n=1 Tax=Paralvinella palmiformis TaxID=53620 RepID=A0AAD9JH56_9ANNE|nr:hypothetical protein LSH36_309g01036 [Paralvinella palmiformis]
MMAALMGRLSGRAILKAPNCLTSQKANLSFRTLSKGKKIAAGVAGAAAAGAVALQTAVFARELELHPPSFPWSYKGIFDSYDHASVRRGYQVYKQVCAACHTMDYMYYRNLVGVIMTEDQAKAEAAEIDVLDGPDDEGKMFNRPGKLSDRFPQPYANEEAAKVANMGAFPPDLTFIINAREGGADYIFSLLTGYWDRPAGCEEREGLHYNPYFAGGYIAMAQALYNEAVEFDDGTPATSSQMAKDVTTFLAWAAEPEMDERKRMGIKTMIVLGILLFFSFYYKRVKWLPMKTKKIAYKPRKH